VVFLEEFATITTLYSDYSLILARQLIARRPSHRSALMATITRLRSAPPTTGACQSAGGGQQQQQAPGRRLAVRQEGVF
jgi:hypothetical protein